jgi:membrane-associated phospholipid phosphatase
MICQKMLEPLPSSRAYGWHLWRAGSKSWLLASLLATAPLLSAQALLPRRPLWAQASPNYLHARRHLASLALAQAPRSVTTPWQAPGRIWRDQKKLWAAPFHITSRQAQYLPLAGAVLAGLIATDASAARAVKGSPAEITNSRNASDYLMNYGMLGASAGLYFDGWLGGHVHRGQAGWHALESAADATIIGFVLKNAFQRERPYQDSGAGHFWAGGSSFPSGHALAAWAIAASLSRSYPHATWLHWLAYGTATAICVLRVTAQHHFPADVATGGFLGDRIGVGVTPVWSSQP